MPNPKILVTSAAGHTGYAAVLNLLEKGFPVRAFVHRRDVRAQALEKAGAEVFCGDLFDYRDIRTALIGVQRAYHIPPFAPNLLEEAMLFALAAEEAKLEVVALMSQWLPHPVDPSIVTREHWIANQVYRWMPSVDVIHINPGLFAFTYLLGLPAIVNMGIADGTLRRRPQCAAFQRRHRLRRRGCSQQSGTAHWQKLPTDGPGTAIASRHRRYPG